MNSRCCGVCTRQDNVTVVSRDLKQRSNSRVVHEAPHDFISGQKAFISAIAIWPPDIPICSLFYRSRSQAFTLNVRLSITSIVEI